MPGMDKSVMRMFGGISTADSSASMGLYAEKAAIPLALRIAVRVSAMMGSSSTTKASGRKPCCKGESAFRGTASTGTMGKYILTYDAALFG